MKTRLRTAVRAIMRADSSDEIIAAIAAAETEAREAGAEATRQAELARELLDDDQAEAAEARSRSEDRRRRRAEARVAELRERLAAASWKERDQAFRKHQRELAKLVQRVAETMQEAVEANAALAAARHTAIGEVGNSISICPPPYLGLCLPDLFGTWRRQADRQLEALARASLPPPPPVPGAAPAPVQPVALPRPPVAAVPPPAAPAPRPPVRQQRRDGPPGEGEKQFHFMASGIHQLPDGSMAIMGDYVTRPADAAERFVRAGVGDIFNVPSAPVTAPEPALVMEAANG